MGVTSCVGKILFISYSIQNHSSLEACIHVPKMLVTGERPQLPEGASHFHQELQILTWHKSIKTVIPIQTNGQSYPGAHACTPSLREEYEPCSFQVLTQYLQIPSSVHFPSLLRHAYAVTCTVLFLCGFLVSS